MKITVHASSSAGNLYSLESGKSRILFECGLTANKLIKALDYNLNRFDACFVSHFHSDHCKGIDFVIRSGIPTYATKETFDKCNVSGNVMEIGKTVFIKNLAIKSFQTEHDCPGSCGFFVKDTESGKKMIFATDTYFLRQKFPALNFIMVECNFSDELLDADENCGYRERLKKSHMSINNLKLWLEKQDLSELEEIYLMHLSDSHSDENDFRNQINELTFADVIICKK